MFASATNERRPVIITLAGGGWCGERSVDGGGRETTDTSYERTARSVKEESRDLSGPVNPISGTVRREGQAAPRKKGAWTMRRWLLAGLGVGLVGVAALLVALSS